MEIKDLLRFLETTQNTSEIITEETLNQLKAFASDFMSKLPAEDFEYRWRILTALLIAGLHCSAVHETYLINELEVVKKTLYSLEKSIIENIKKSNKTEKKIHETQLLYIYRMFNYYLSRAGKIAKLKHYAILSKKMNDESHIMHEHMLARSHKLSQKISLFQHKLRINIKTHHYYLYTFLCAIGIIAFWHGAWGIFDILEMSPYITVTLGILILLLTGMFLKEFIGEKGRKDECD